uniref:Uncharacterized protein n=1 Tax=Arundo donax TaxID=35708 RepID=A0A0A8Z9X7_ARUDO
MYVKEGDISSIPKLLAHNMQKMNCLEEEISWPHMVFLGDD